MVIVNAKLSEKQHLDRDLTLENAVTQVWQKETVKQPTPLRSATKDPPVLHYTREGIYLETRRTHSRQSTSWPQLRHIIINLPRQHVPGEANHPSMTDSSVQQKKENTKLYVVLLHRLLQSRRLKQNPFWASWQTAVEIIGTWQYKSAVIQCGAALTWELIRQQFRNDSGKR